MLLSWLKNGSLSGLRCSFAHQTPAFEKAAWNFSKLVALQRAQRRYALICEQNLVATHARLLCSCQPEACSAYACSCTIRLAYIVRDTNTRWELAMSHLKAASRPRIPAFDYTV